MTLVDTAAQLHHLTEGLTFPSEVDTPWQVVVWPGMELTDALLRQRLNQAAEAPVSSQTLANLSAQVQQRCRGYGAEGKAIAVQHQQLFQYLEQQLCKVQVFRVGAVTVEVVVLGIAETGDWVGVQTQSVET